MRVMCCDVYTGKMEIFFFCSKFTHHEKINLTSEDFCKKTNLIYSYVQILETVEWYVRS